MATLAEIRSRAKQHEEAILSLGWFTPAELKDRWRFKSLSSIYAIPIEQLRYKEFGTGAKKRRRYREDWVIAYEEATPDLNSHPASGSGSETAA